mmetsp:Transcript_60436/g.187129  ORF Transcript_60436/g.187129 Transcript_60436/m.187129 type:complete len:215 (+) Transcript_60436:23-667(+)
MRGWADPRGHALDLHSDRQYPGMSHQPDQSPCNGFHSKPLARGSGPPGTWWMLPSPCPDTPPCYLLAASRLLPPAREESVPAPALRDGHAVEAQRAAFRNGIIAGTAGARDTLLHVWAAKLTGLALLAVQAVLTLSETPPPDALLLCSRINHVAVQLVDLEQPRVIRPTPPALLSAKIALRLSTEDQVQAQEEDNSNTTGHHGGALRQARPMPK